MKKPSLCGVRRRMGGAGAGEEGGDSPQISRGPHWRGRGSAHYLSLLAPVYENHNRSW